MITVNTLDIWQARTKSELYRFWGVVAAYNRFYCRTALPGKAFFVHVAEAVKGQMIFPGGIYLPA